MKKDVWYVIKLDDSYHTGVWFTNPENRGWKDGGVSPWTTDINEAVVFDGTGDLLRYIAKEWSPLFNRYWELEIIQVMPGGLVEAGKVL
jgi:hypothetical protein